MTAPAALPWVVLKFGGTSVASAERWERIARRTRELLAEHRVWIVVSAVAGVTDALERAVREARAGGSAVALEEIRTIHRRLAEEIGVEAAALAPVRAILDQVDAWLSGIRLTGEAPPRLVARVLAAGELASTRLGVAALARHGLDARWVDAREVLASAAPRRGGEHRIYLEAEVSAETRPERGETAAGGAALVLTQGFLARTPQGETCLLGRGGSDTSAALFAVLLDARALEIWTDVPGLFTADPRLVPAARLIRRIGYREAEEIAATGAKVLHPRCLAPAAAAGIPVLVRSIDDPGEEGTRIDAGDEHGSAVTAVTCRTGVTLLSLSTIAMWHEAGFLAQVFAPFEELGVSVDLVATSASTISLTLDRLPDGPEGPTFRRLVERLERACRVEIVKACAEVTVVGRRIRAALPEVGAAFAAFRERPVLMVSDSAEDLNLSFVVREEDAQPLVALLHERLFPLQGGEPRLGPTWELLDERAERGRPVRRWWRARRRELIELVADGAPRYVYDLPTVAAAAERLRAALRSADRLYYSMKANPHPRILETVVVSGFGLECVSVGEVRRARETVGDEVPLLFTPNLCPVEEYALALAAGAEVVVDGPEVLAAHPEIFRGRRIGLRVDPGEGLGHHEKVRTAGPQAKFGCALEEAAAVRDAAARAGARVVGLHAHAGSGIFDPEAWARSGRALGRLLEQFPEVEWLDLGGGLGVPERPAQGPLDLAAVERSLARLSAAVGRRALRLEPGRFLVSAAGVLVAPVTQVRTKAGVRFVGLAAGMNALLRPALYGAWHGIHNLTRFGDKPAGYCHVVGPICESADVLGIDRRLPETRPGDVLLIENAGAYGHVMASEYNLRERPAEVVLP